jgi:hypothetical protein
VDLVNKLKVFYKSIKTLRDDLVFLCLLVLLSGCAAVPTSQDFTRFGIQSSQDSSIVLHLIDNEHNPTTHLGSLRVQINAQDYITSGRDQITLPSSISGQFPNDTKTLQTIQYSISQIRNTSSDEAWFWRAPVLHPKAIELDSITTVVFEMLTMLSEQAFWNGQISREQWEGLYAYAFRNCIRCQTKSVKSVFEDLSSSTVFLDQMSSILSTPPLSANNFSSPTSRAVYWYPGNLMTSIQEGKKLQLFTYFWNINSLQPLSTIWVKNAAVESYTGSAYTWDIPMDAEGSHTISAERLVGIHNVRKTFLIDVINVNQAPSWTTAPITQAANTVLEIDLKTLVIDPDGDELTFSLSQAPSGAVLVGDMLTLSPSNADIGTKMIAVYADDGNESVPALIPWTITGDNLPVFSASPTTWALNEGNSGSITLNATDADGDDFIIECLSGCPAAFATQTPAGANIMANTILSPGQHQFTFTPDYKEVITNASRTFVMRFKTKYTGLGKNQSVGTEYTVSVTITNIDDEPRWTVTPNPGGAVENVAYSFSLSANDPSPASPGSLSYSCPTKPAWLNVNSTTGVASGTPGFNAATGEMIDIVCRATDSRGLYVEWTGQIEVLNTNRPTTNISPIPDPLLSGGANAEEGVLFSYDISVHFFDPDIDANDPLDSLSFICNNCPSGMSINTSTGVINWTPGFSQSGTYNGITFSVSDSGGLQYTSDPVSIIVENREGPPLLTLSQSSITVAEMSSGTVSLDVNHASGDSYDYDVAYSCTPVCPVGMVDLPVASGTFGDSPLSFNITPNYDHGNAAHPATGKSYSIEFTVSKNGDPSLNIKRTLTLTVQNTNRLPTDILFNGQPSGDTDLTLSNNGYIPTTNVVYLAPVDEDGANDKYVFSVNANHGTILGSGGSLRWEFNPSSFGCWPGGMTSVITAAITMIDSRGGSITRNIVVNVSNTAPRGSPCPY